MIKNLKIYEPINPYNNAFSCSRNVGSTLACVANTMALSTDNKHSIKINDKIINQSWPEVTTCAQLFKSKNGPYNFSKSDNLRPPLTCFN